MRKWKTRQTKTKFCVQLKRCQFSFVLMHSTIGCVCGVWTFQLSVVCVHYSFFLFVRSLCVGCHFLQRYSCVLPDAPTTEYSTQSSVAWRSCFSYICSHRKCHYACFRLNKKTNVFYMYFGNVFNPCDVGFSTQTMNGFLNLQNMINVCQMIGIEPAVRVHFLAFFLESSLLSTFLAFCQFNGFRRYIGHGGTVTYAIGKKESVKFNAAEQKNDRTQAMTTYDKCQQNPSN